jgi:hypothetical protein
VTFTERESVPLDPVTVTVAVPAFVCFLVVNVNTELPEGPIVAGLKVAPTNFGSAPTERDTGPENPPDGTIAIVYVASVPFCTVLLVGVPVRAKSPAGVTTSVTLAVWVTGPLVPRTVSV